MNKNLGKIILGAAVGLGVLGTVNCPNPTKVIDNTNTIYIQNEAEDIAERQAILGAADRMVKLQNANGSWDWDVTNQTAPTANTYANIAGVDAECLIDAYDLTNNTKYLDAAKKTGDYLVNIAITPTSKENSANILFLYHLKNASGNNTYKAKADAMMNHMLHETNGFSTFDTDGITGLSAQELLNATMNNRSWAGNPSGIVAWDLYQFVQDAQKYGDNAFAQDIASKVRSYIDQSGYNSSVTSYTLGLGAGIEASKDAGLNYTDYANKLIARQKADGSMNVDPINEGLVQTTAYALMALDKINSPEAKKAAQYLVDNFGYNGLKGWLETDGVEYSESTSEAAHALYQNHKK